MKIFGKNGIFKRANLKVKFLLFFKILKNCKKRANICTKRAFLKQICTRLNPYISRDLGFFVQMCKFFYYEVFKIKNEIYKKFMKIFCTFARDKKCQERRKKDGFL